MREEEEEALRIQKEQLAGMDEEDFMDDALTGWGIGAEQDAEADKKLVDSVSKDLEDISFEWVYHHFYRFNWLTNITFSVKKVESRRKNMPVTEKLKIIQNESPELIDLTDEFKEKSELISVISGLVEK